jgi:hypothetical protein
MKNTPLLLIAIAGLILANCTAFAEDMVVFAPNGPTIHDSVRKAKINGTRSLTEPSGETKLLLRPVWGINFVRLVYCPDKPRLKFGEPHGKRILTIGFSRALSRR